MTGKEDRHQLSPDYKRLFYDVVCGLVLSMGKSLESPEEGASVERSEQTQPTVGSTIPWAGGRADECLGLYMSEGSLLSKQQHECFLSFCLTGSGVSSCLKFSVFTSLK